jgi:N-methylhydantoinase A
MYKIINTNMAQGVRQVSIERGYDPREFLIIVAGGAGPIHAAEICKELEIPLFVVPETSSIFCAAGMLLGDLKHDYIHSYLVSYSQIDKQAFMDHYKQMMTEGTETLLKEGVNKENINYYPTLDLRYVRQYHELQLAVPWDQILSCDFATIHKEFHKEHNRLFGYSLEDEGTEIELINLRLRVQGETEKPNFIREESKRIPLTDALKEKRKVYIPETKVTKEIEVYDGDLSLCGNKITGPALIEKVTTSIFVSEQYDCVVDEFGSFIVYNRNEFPDGFKINSNHKNQENYA